MKDKKGILAKIIRYTVLLQVFGALLSGLVVLWIQITTINVSTLPFELDRYAMYRIHPGFYLFPLIGTVFGLFYLYSFLKLKALSMKNWFLAFLSLTILPINYLYLGVKFSSAVMNADYNQSFSWKQLILAILNTNYQIIISLFSSISVLGIAIILLLLVKSRFKEKDINLSKRAKYVLVAFSLIFIFPVLAITSYGFYQTNNVSDDYNKTQKGLDFNLRKANYLPEGMKQRTKYFINNSGGVNVLYEYGELKDAYLGIPYKEGTIIISQSKADQNKTLDIAIKNKLYDDQPNEVSLSTAKDDKAIFFINPRTNDRLVFITDDGVSVQILGNKIEHEEYLKIAESLK